MDKVKLADMTGPLNLFKLSGQCTVSPMLEPDELRALYEMP